MGTVKDESRRKSCDLHVRLTDADMQTVRSNCRIAGYRSMSRFVRMRLTSSCMPRRTAVQENAAGNVPDWMQEQIEKLALQVRGVAKNYNQSVTVMNTLVRHVADRDSQRMIIRRAARLDAMTHELVGILQDIRGTVGEMKESLSQQEGLKELEELNQAN